MVTTMKVVSKIERIFATVLGCEDALVRPQIMSGTNALYLTLSALLNMEIQ